MPDDPARPAPTERAGGDPVIDVHKLTNDDVGREVTYFGPDQPEYGRLTSWNDFYVFVRFSGPGGEACDPTRCDFSFQSAEP